MPKPRIIILAGPNGAGKTTMSKFVIPNAYDVREFVNADRIAAGLSAFSPESVAFEAGRIMLKRIHQLLNEGSSFAFETTLASKSFVRLIKRAHARGYEVTLVYVALPSVQMARRRVKKRVRAGGHDIAPEVIERRFHRGLANLIQLYIPVVDLWFVYDNSAPEVPRRISAGGAGVIEVDEEEKWQRLLRLAAKSQS